MKWFISIIWFVVTFLIPIFQGYFSGNLKQENGKLNFKDLLKSKLFWMLMISWVVGSVCMLIMDSQEISKEYPTSSNENSNNSIHNNGDNSTIINGDDNISISGDVYFILDKWVAVDKNIERVSLGESQDDYLKYLKEVINGEIAFYDYNDYDGDGKCEMFALVGENDAEWANLSGELWFVNQTGAQKIEYDKRIYWSNPQTYRINGQCFLALEEYYATGSVTFLWSVKNGVPYQPNLSGRGNGISVNVYNEIELVDSEYDAGETEGMMSGHTYKKYYFYYDGENFREYGGREIKRQELLQIKGVDEILVKMEKEGYSINSIFYRGNYVCNINFSKEKQGWKDYENVTFRFNDKFEIVSSLENELHEGGIYKAAFIPEMATYPENLFK